MLNISQSSEIAVTDSEENSDFFFNQKFQDMAI